MNVPSNYDKDSSKTYEDTPKTSTSQTSKDVELGYTLSDFLLPKDESTVIEKIFIVLSYILVVLFFPLSLFTVFIVVRQFERVVILRNGKLITNKTYGPGLIFYLPCVDVIKFIDLRIITHCVHTQEVLTMDSMTIAVEAVVHYRISNAIAATTRAKDYKSATNHIAATTLRNAIGTKTLSEVLKKRHEISSHVFEAMQQHTAEWGVTVVRVGIKDIRLPMHMQKTMATEAASARLANAKIIVSRSEIECTKSYQKAASLLSEYPLGMPLRFLQTLDTVIGEKTHTIIIPFPFETMKNIFK